LLSSAKFEQGGSAAQNAMASPANGDDFSGLTIIPVIYFP
jgi:hypothetical protein